MNAVSNNLVLTGADAINGTGNSLNNVLMGNKAANVLNGMDGRDWLYGSGGLDKLYGMQGNDYLSGGEADDILSGWDGDDELVGGRGNDTLMGGAGHDSFTFYEANAGTDKIVDFSISDDQIRISKTGFNQDSAIGNLSADQFVLGTTASDSNDRFIYDSSTGTLFFDEDGNGSGAQMQIAVFSSKPSLTASQISIV